jgi:hypothetical protein
MSTSTDFSVDTIKADVWHVLPDIWLMGWKNPRAVFEFDYKATSATLVRTRPRPMAIQKYWRLFRMAGFFKRRSEYYVTARCPYRADIFDATEPSVQPRQNTNFPHL